jgi:hypothetical protein
LSGEALIVPPNKKVVKKNNKNNFNLFMKTMVISHAMSAVKYLKKDRF